MERLREARRGASNRIWSGWGRMKAERKRKEEEERREEEEGKEAEERPPKIC